MSEYGKSFLKHTDIIGISAVLHITEGYDSKEFMPDMNIGFMANNQKEVAPMTTIAYKDGLVSYDSRATIGDSIDDDNIQKLKIVDGVKFFAAGSLCDVDRLIELYFGRTTNFKALDASAFVFDGNKFYICSVSDRGFWKCENRLNYHYALGTGQDHALTAMDCGKTAAEAVRLAAKRDTKTGGRIRTCDVSA